MSMASPSLRRDLREPRLRELGLHARSSPPSFCRLPKCK